MPRYYLHLRRGREVALDRIGTEFHDQVTVELTAMRAAARAWRSMDVPADPSQFALEIMDEAGRSILTIALSEVLMAD